MSMRAYGSMLRRRIITIKMCPIYIIWYKCYFEISVFEILRVDYIINPNYSLINYYVNYSTMIYVNFWYYNLCKFIVL